MHSLCVRRVVLYYPHLFLPILVYENGSGKTTICRCFLSQLKPNVKYALIFNPCLSELQVLEAIVDDFGIRRGFFGLRKKLKTKKDYFDAINRFLLKQTSKGNNVVVIIDEAQNLTMSVLEQIRLLSNLETESEKLLQIIFFGQPEFREMLQQSSMKQLRQRIGVRYHLTALNQEESQEYVYHRLKIAGVD
ncbi:AAA family ATPase, partial [candidate division KSB1 bacterium]|nr:AAA family ATPase [candidate division KSB1 bacterium]